MPTSQRPTIPPEFDVEQYAKDSDAQIKSVKPTAAPPAQTAEAETPRASEMRIATHPRVGRAVTDEAWARDMSGTLVVAIGVAELKKLPLDHRAGFLLSQMDGSLDIETLVEVSGLPRDDALRIVRDLYESGVVKAR